MVGEANSVRRSRRWLPTTTAAGITLLAGSAILANMSITGSYDDSCGSILDSTAVWASRSSCGIAHRGTLAIVLVLVCTGIALLAIRSLGSAGTSRPRTAVRVLTAATSLTAGATALVALHVASYEEPVLRRGWAAVRNTAGFASLGLGLITAMVVAPTLIGRPAAPRFP